MATSLRRSGIRSLLKYSSSLLLAFSLAAGPCAAASTGTVAAAPAAPVTAQIVARLLEEGHYGHKPITADTSQELLKLYLRMYDPARLFFLASDVDEFNSRFGLGTALRLEAGDVEPGYFIFNRFRERLRERVGWVHELVRSTYTFDSGGAIMTDRRDASWPSDSAAARGLWRNRIEFDLLQEKLNAVKPEEWAGNVLKNYDRLLDNYNELESSDVLQSYLTALAACYDPHSEYMAAHAEENFDINLGISLIGIGVSLQAEGGYPKIVAIIPGGPAEKSGAFHVNDRIAAVAQGDDGPFVEAAGMRLDRVVKMIRGVKGTVVRLKLIPADALDPLTRVTVSMVRDKILLRDQQARAQILLVPGKKGRDLRLGVIKLPSFYTRIGPSGEESTARDVRTLLNHLKQQDVAGVILDLRSNGGGSLEEAVAMTGLFLGGGPVVQVRDSRGAVRVINAPGGAPEYTGPLLALDSRFSASASEIVSAALKDYGRAVLAGGKSTFGKGTVQTVVDLDQFMPQHLRKDKAGGLRLTVQKFYRVSGGSTQNRGVEPDIVLPSVDDYLDITESSLPNALAYDEIPPAHYNRAGFVSSIDITRLQAFSFARVALSPDFKFVKEDIALYLERKKDKTVSLNYAKHLAERKEEEDRKAARHKERAARGATPLPVAEITLQDIESGKLPVFKSTPSVEAAITSGTARGAAAPEQAVSSSSAAGAAVSSATVEGAGYARAPPAGDFVLEEAARVLADLIGFHPAARSPGDKVKR